MLASPGSALALAVFCGCAYASDLVATTPKVSTEVVSKGRAPVGRFGYWYMRAVAIPGSRGQLLAVPEQDAIDLLRMRDTALTPAYAIPLTDTSFSFETGPGSGTQKRKAFWTSGDIDSDGNDEVIVALDTLVLVYRRHGTAFVPESMTLPRAARQMVVGDIDNDGRNELIACCDTTTNGRWREGYTEMKYQVYVCELVDRKLDVVWTDSAKLGYGEPEMPDYFWSVADFRNVGRNQLLVTGSQSDMSPTVYDLLEWSRDASGLVRRASFLVSDTIVPTSSRVWDIYPYAVGRMQPLRTGLGTAVMVEFGDMNKDSSGDWESVFRHRLLRIEDGAMQSLGDLWYEDRPPGSNCYYAVFDPDGAGQGVLRVLDLWYPQPGKCFYEFRRVALNRQQPSR